MGGNRGTTRTRPPGPPPRPRSRFGHGSPGSVFPRRAPRAAAGLPGPSSLTARCCCREIPANSRVCKISPKQPENTFPAGAAVRRRTSDRFPEGRAGEGGQPPAEPARRPAQRRGPFGEGAVKKLNSALPGVLNPEPSHLPSPRYALACGRRWLRSGSVAHLGLRKRCRQGREAGWQGRAGKQRPGAVLEGRASGAEGETSNETVLGFLLPPAVLCPRTPARTET